MILSSESQAVPISGVSPSPKRILEKLKSEWEQAFRAPLPGLEGFQAALAALDDAVIAGGDRAAQSLRSALRPYLAGTDLIPEPVALGVAQLLLIIEDSLGVAPDRNLGQRIEAACQRLDTALGAPSAAATLPPILEALSGDMGRLHLAEAIDAEARRAKLAVHAWATQGVIPSDIERLLNGLEQVAAALDIAEAPSAADVARRCRDTLNGWLDADGPDASEAGEVLSADLDTLVRMARERAHPSVCEAVEPEDRCRISLDAVSDAEIFEVYSEELAEWFSATRAELADLDARPDQPKLLTAVRRAFHTLKGTSRVAGFNHLGEVAWNFEELLNDWINAAQPANHELLALLQAGVARFENWLDELRDLGQVAVVADDLLARIAALGVTVAIDEAAQPRTANAPAPAVSAAPDSPAEQVTLPEKITLAEGLTVSRTLFDIFLQEAEGHLAELADAIASGALERPLVPPLIRYAHTLAGISRTVGVAATERLAHAMERLFLARQATTGLVATEERRWIETAVAELTTALGELRQQRLPTLKADVAERLYQAAARAEPTNDEVARGPVSATDSAWPDASISPDTLASDTVDAGLRATFLEEAAELAARLSAGLQAWQAEPDESRHSEDVLRWLHTLKGSARAAGFMALGETVHGLETLVLESLRPGATDSTLLDFLQGTFDQWCGVIEAAAGHGLSPVGSAAAADVSLEDFGTESKSAFQAQLRVSVGVLERLLDTSAEVALTRSRIAAELDAAKRAAADMEERVKHLREHLREIEIQAESQMRARYESVEHQDAAFDPLEFDRYTRLQELTRIMAESLYDLTTVQYGIRRYFGEAEGRLGQQARLQRNLHADLMHIRTIAFGSASDRLQRIARQTAAELGRKAKLTIVGAQLELDRTMLERLLSPLEHMIRNAIAHGIEPPAQRQRAGKPEAGQLRLVLTQEANTIHINFSDDGGGIDWERVRRRAESLGLLDGDEAPDPERLRGLIFRPGFSTAERLTEVAGRGVGMDVVLNTVQSMGGDVLLDSTPGGGTQFTLTVPLTLVVSQTVVIRSGEHSFAIPANLITHIHRCDSAGLMALMAAGHAEWGGERYRFRYLGELLGQETLDFVLKRNNIVLYLRSARERLALQVDSIVGNQEVTLKELGPQLAGAFGVVGATIGQDGRPMLLINPLQMVRGRDVSFDAPLPDLNSRASLEPLVLIVDDSLTVRKVTSRLMERAGYRVMTAKDGIEATERMREELPAIFLLDIEMPRMDGFELIKLIREDSRTETTPIIVISSRTADKHRQHAYDLGASLFLGKPYQDVELLRQIERLGLVSRQGGSAVDAAERRKHPRVRPRETLTVRDALKGKVLGTVVNVSVSGCLLKTAERFGTNRVYHVHLDLPGGLNAGQPLRLVMESVWMESSFESGQFWAGFRFVHPDSRDTKILQMLVSAHCS